MDYTIVVCGLWDHDSFIRCTARHSEVAIVDSEGKDKTISVCANRQGAEKCPYRISANLKVDLCHTS